MKKFKRLMVLSSLFIIPLLSLGQDASSFSQNFSRIGTSSIGNSISLADAIIVVLALIFFREVYKFFLDQKRLRGQEGMDTQNEGI